MPFSHKEPPLSAIAPHPLHTCKESVRFARHPSPRIVFLLPSKLGINRGEPHSAESKKGGSRVAGRPGVRQNSKR